MTIDWDATFGYEYICVLLSFAHKFKKVYSLNSQLQLPHSKLFAMLNPPLLYFLRIGLLLHGAFQGNSVKSTECLLMLLFEDETDMNKSVSMLFGSLHPSCLVRGLDISTDHTCWLWRSQFLEQKYTICVYRTLGINLIYFGASAAV